MSSPSSERQMPTELACPQVQCPDLHTPAPRLNFEQRSCRAAMHPERTTNHRVMDHCLRTCALSYNGPQSHSRKLRVSLSVIR